MRSMKCVLTVAAIMLAACGTGAVGDDDGDGGSGIDGGGTSFDAANPGDPVLVAGGGVAPGAIDGTIHVHVIDAKTGAAISGANVRVGAADASAPLEATTSGSGLHTFDDASLSGAQTVTAVANGYAAATWIGVAGLNVTIPLKKRPQATFPTANVSGTIAGWSDLGGLGFTEYYAAFVAYSASEDLADPENNIEQAVDGDDIPVNTCMHTYFDDPPCNWQMKVRTGKQIHYSVIIKGDSNGSTDPADHDIEFLGFAVKTGLDISAGQTINNESLTMVSAGNIVNASATVPSPPGGIDSAVGLPFLDMGTYGQLIFAIPTITPSNATTKVIANSGDFSGGNYFVAGSASPSAENVDFPNSSTFKRGVSFPGTAALDPWLAYPTSLSASGGSYSFSPASGASLHSANFYDGSGNTVWSVVLVDGSSSFTLPTLSPDALPSGSLELRVLAVVVPGLATDDFSLDDWRDELTKAAEASTNFTH